jgi:hypothetical protein
MNISAYGFVPVGEWTTRDSVKSGITYDLTTLALDRVVYAFVIDGVPKYIGICEKDTTTLKDRMGRYKAQQGSRPQGVSTNERISIEIRRVLDQGKRVEIYALKPTAKLMFVDLQVDLVKGLENPLVAEFKPEWNR